MTIVCLPGDGIGPEVVAEALTTTDGVLALGGGSVLAAQLFPEIPGQGNGADRAADNQYRA